MPAIVPVPKELQTVLPHSFQPDAPTNVWSDWARVAPFEDGGHIIFPSPLCRREGRCSVRGQLFRGTTLSPPRGRVSIGYYPKHWKPVYVCLSRRIVDDHGARNHEYILPPSSMPFTLTKVCRLRRGTGWQHALSKVCEQAMDTCLSEDSKQTTSRHALLFW